MRRREFIRKAAAVALTPVVVRAGEIFGEQKMQTMMERAIPRDGKKLPCIGLGTWQTFDVNPDDAEHLLPVLKRFYERGGRVVDSSPMYGRAESITGLLSERLGLNAKLFLATKVWTSGRPQGEAQMNESLRRMERISIELMQVHNLLDWKTHLSTIRRWKGEGRIQYDGITHYTPSAFKDLESVMRSEKPDFVQLPYSIVLRNAEKRLLPLAQELGIGVIVNRPFEGGELFPRLRNKPVPKDAAAFGCKTWAQVLLKFIVSHPAVTVVIPATSKVSHLEDNMEAGIGPFPNGQEREALAEMILKTAGP